MKSIVFGVSRWKMCQLTAPASPVINKTCLRDVSWAFFFFSFSFFGGGWNAEFKRVEPHPLDPQTVAAWIIVRENWRLILLLFPRSKWCRMRERKREWRRRRCLITAPSNSTSKKNPFNYEVHRVSGCFYGGRSRKKEPRESWERQINFGCTPTNKREGKINKNKRRWRMRSNINMQTPSHKYITVNADAKIIRAYLKSFGNRKMTRTFGRKRNKKKKKKNDKNFIFPSSFRLYPSYIYIYRLYTQLQAWRVIAKSNPSRERCGWLAFGNES
jgi:hypothetical protein